MCIGLADGISADISATSDRDVQPHRLVVDGVDVVIDRPHHPVVEQAATVVTVPERRVALRSGAARFAEMIAGRVDERVAEISPDLAERKSPRWRAPVHVRELLEPGVGGGGDRVLHRLQLVTDLLRIQMSRDHARMTPRSSEMRRRISGRSLSRRPSRRVLPGRRP